MAKKVCAKHHYSEKEATQLVNGDILRLLNGKKMHQQLRTAYYCKPCKAWHVSSMTADSPFLNDIKTNGVKQPVSDRERLEHIIELKEKERREWADMCIKKQKEIERLRALLEKTFMDFFNIGYPNADTKSWWKQFKEENNLNESPVQTEDEKKEK